MTAQESSADLCQQGGSSAGDARALYDSIRLQVEEQNGGGVVQSCRCRGKMLAPAPALTAFVVARDCRFQRGDEEGGGGCAPTSAAKGAQGIKKMEMERAAAPIGWVIGCRFFFKLLLF